MNRKCLRKHGDEYPQNRITKFCIQPNCEIKLACGECTDDYHLNHTLIKLADFQTFYVQNGAKINKQQLDELIVNVNNCKKELISNIEKICNRIFDSVPQLVDYSGLDSNQLTEQILNDILNETDYQQSLDSIMDQYNILEKILFTIENEVQLYDNRMKQFQRILSVPQIFSSSIISQTSSDYQSFFSNSIVKRIGNAKQLKLLFTGSQDGLSSDQLRQKCQDNNNLLFLISTEQGQIIGGYTPLLFKDYGKLYIPDPDNSTFIFSITKQEIYPIIPNKDSLYISYDNDCTQISFGWQDIALHLVNCQKDNNVFSTIKSVFPRNFSIDQYPNSKIPKNSWDDKVQYLIATRHQSRIIDLEVFQLIMDE